MLPEHIIFYSIGIGAILLLSLSALLFYLFYDDGKDIQVSFSLKRPDSWLSNFCNSSSESWGGFDSNSQHTKPVRGNKGGKTAKGRGEKIT